MHNEKESTCSSPGSPGGISGDSSTEESSPEERKKRRTPKEGKSLISLTKGKFAIVDSIDFEWLSKRKWGCMQIKKSDKFYAVSGKNLMHRLINKTPKGMQTDHRDGDGLNNTRMNLRNATNAQNMRNCGKHKNNTSGFKGVSWSNQAGKWQCHIRLRDGRRKNLGLFSTKEEAFHAYRIKALQEHGEFFRA